MHPFDQLVDIERRGHERALSELSNHDYLPNVEGKLALRLGPWHLMLSLDDLAEIIPVPRITRVPGVEPWLLGIANLRGTIATIIDLKQFLSNASTGLTANSRVIIIRFGKWSYGVVVDEIIGMRHFEAESELSALTEIDVGIRPYLIGAFHSEEKEWLVFSVEKLQSNFKFLGKPS